MSAKIFDVILKWIPLAVIVTALSGLVYAAGQQNLRSSANYPQIQWAEDAAAALAAGVQPQSVLSAGKVDVAASLAPYLIVFGEDGQPLASSAQLDGSTPSIPAGVFAYTREHGEDRLTWQPRAGVRSAIVVTYFRGSASGFVVAGRSLREVERQEDNLFLIVCAAWLASLGAALAASVLLVAMQTWRATWQVGSAAAA